MLKFLQGIEDMVFCGFIAALPLIYMVVLSFLPTCEEAAQEKIEPMHPQTQSRAHE